MRNELNDCGQTEEDAAILATNQLMQLRWSGTGTGRH